MHFASHDENDSNLSFLFDFEIAPFGLKYVSQTMYTSNNIKVHPGTRFRPYKYYEPENAIN